MLDVCHMFHPIPRGWQCWFEYIDQEEHNPVHSSDCGRAAASLNSQIQQWSPTSMNEMSADTPNKIL